MSHILGKTPKRETSVRHETLFLLLNIKGELQWPFGAHHPLGDEAICSKSP